MLILCVAAAGGVGVGEGVVGAGFESLPHAAKVSPATRTRAYRSDMPGAGCKGAAHRDRAVSGLFEIGKQQRAFEKLNAFQNA
jgi:hypothetical protein